MGRCDVTDDALLIEFEAEYPDKLESEEDAEYGCCAQGWAWVEVVDTRSLVSRPCASTVTSETPAVGHQIPDSSPPSLTPHPLNVQESQFR